MPLFENNPRIKSERTANRDTLVDLKSLLEDVSEGETSVDEALKRVEGVTRVDDFDRFDTQSRDRTGVPEAIPSEDKRPSEVVVIVESALEKEG